MSIDIQPVTGELRPAAIALLVRFFREEGFTTPPPLIAENLDRMLADRVVLVRARGRRRHGAGGGHGLDGALCRMGQAR